MKKIRHNLKGFSLVEMMVAMLIGLIILAGVSVIYLSSKKTFNLGSNMVSVHENGRFAINYLVKDIQKAGWIDSSVVPSEGFSLTQPLINFKNNVAVAGGKSSDAITVRYYGEQNCKGEAPTDGIVENTYQLVPGAELSELQCNGVTLLKNVESFQIRYGVLSQNGLHYVSPDSIVPQSIIKSVQVALTVASNQKNVMSENDVTISNVLGEGPYTFNDGRYRQVFSNTILLNNAGSLPPDELLVSE